MKKRNLINLLLVIIAVVVVALCAFSVRLDASADKVTVLQADGITCGNCTAAITRALQKEQGVAAVAVDEAAGRVVVGFDSKAVTPEIMANRVSATGYGCRVMLVQNIDEYRSASGDLKAGPAARKCCCAKNRK